MASKILVFLSICESSKNWHIYAALHTPFHFVIVVVVYSVRWAFETALFLCDQNLVEDKNCNVWVITREVIENDIKKLDKQNDQLLLRHSFLHTQNSHSYKQQQY